MATFKQGAFTAGELSPELYGRADLVRYSQGLRTCKNFIVQRQGGLKNRYGTLFVNTTGTSEQADKRTRIIEFVFNNEQAYIAEMTDGLMRFYQDGGLVEDTNGVIELESPYAADELFDVQYNQVGDIVIMVHPSHPIHELRRVPDGELITFELEEQDNSPQQDAPLLTNLNINMSEPPEDPVQNWYVATAINRDTGEESLISNELSGVGPQPSFETQWQFQVHRAANADVHNIYVRRNLSSNPFRLLGTLRFTSESGSFLFFADLGQATTDAQPVTSRNPFNEEGSYPSTVGHYQQRRWFANTNSEPEKVWSSRLGSFTNFTTSRPTQDDDAITFTIAGRSFNDVRHILDVSNLILMTSTGVWLAAGGVGGAITPTQLNLKQQSSSGASKVRPVQVGNNVIFVHSRGNKVTDLRYQFASDGFEGRELSVFSEHLLQGRQIVDWAYQETPDSVIWCVMSDGALIGLTYMPEHEVWGWHRHETKGKFKSVAVIPAGDRDDVYFVVDRGGDRYYLERFNHKDKFFVDSGLTYDGRHVGLQQGITITRVETGSANNHLRAVGEIVTLNASDPFFTESAIGNMVVARNPANADQVVRYAIVERISSTQVKAENMSDIPNWAWSGNVYADWGYAVRRVTGIPHLLAQRVAVVADGNVISAGSDAAGAEDNPITVKIDDDGTVTIPSPAMLIHVGLAYQSEMETLDLEIPEGSLLDRQVNVKRVSVYVRASRGLFVANARGDWQEMKTRQVNDDYDTKSEHTGLFEATISGAWTEAGRVRIAQLYPLPCNIVSVIPQGVLGGSRN